MAREQRHPDLMLITTAVFTGMRKGELLGLRWQDVDLADGVIRIQQTLGRLPGRGWVFREPKTRRSRRQVPIPAVVVAALHYVAPEH